MNFTSPHLKKKDLRKTLARAGLISEFVRVTRTLRDRFTYLSAKETKFIQ